MGNEQEICCCQVGGHGVLSKNGAWKLPFIRRRANHGQRYHVSLSLRDGRRQRLSLRQGPVRDDNFVTRAQVRQRGVTLPTEPSCIMRRLLQSHLFQITETRPFCRQLKLFECVRAREHGRLATPLKLLQLQIAL